MRENEYQAKLIKKITKLLPGCIILKNDSGYRQGIPDLTILYGEKWAALEVKDSANAKHQPNQDYYIREMNDMAFASFVYPENEEEVLRALQQSLGTRRNARAAKSQHLPLD